MIVAFYSQSSYAGKDTCADIAAAWCRSNGISCQRDAFAWDGKVVAADALGIEGTREEKIAVIDKIKHDGYVAWRGRYETVDGDQYVGSSVTGRDFLIGLLGDPEKKTGIRGLDEKFWTGQVLHRDQALERAGGGFTIVSDLRFLEEAESVRYSAGWIVEVRRHSATRFNEQRLPESWVDHVIHNDGTIDGLLRWDVERIMGVINRKALVGGRSHVDLPAT